MERSRLFFISVFVFIITSCSSLGPHPIAPETYQVARAELPREMDFRAYSHKPFTLLFLPEPYDAAALQTRLFSVTFRDRNEGLIGELSFTDDNCNNFFSFSATQAVDGEIRTQYFDDSLPGAERLQVSIFDGQDASGASGTFLGINELKLPLPKGNRIHRVSVSVSHPATISTSNLIDLERK